MKKHKKRGILCAIGAVLFAVAIPQMDSSEPAEIVMAVVIVLVLAFVAVRSLFPNLRLSKKSKASTAAAAPHQREDSQQQRSFPVASRPLADAPAPKQACQLVEPTPVAAPAQTVEQPRSIDIDVEALRRGIVRQPDAPKYQHYEFHVAGVTYKSEDGTPRQEYLRRIDKGIAPFENSDSLDVSLCPFMYKPKGKPEEQAISVRVNGYDIGNVPRESVPAVMEAIHKPGAIISAFKAIGGYEGKNYGAIVVVRHDL